MFFCFDGIDGVGKSTQVSLFCQWLAELGHEVLAYRDPGSTELGEQIRSILLSHGETPIDRRSEMLLYMAARAQLVEQHIRPALEAGKTVVTDRYVLANLAYQGYAGGLDVEDVRRVGLVATAGIMPDCTFVLDLDASRAMERVGRTPDRIEAAGVAFLAKVRQGFLAEARRDPEHVVVIDASGSVDEIQQEIRRQAAAWPAGRSAIADRKRGDR